MGPTQATLELVHRLATDESAATKRILDNVLLIIVPSTNPDGHVMVTDWFYRNVGTPFEVSPLPHLYHKYAGHDLNRDMYMLTQKESQYIARLVWHDWLPAVWLDQHQMNSNGARMFVMPAADPINPNVHPLIYRWNGILGQSQAAALEAAGKEGIIYNSTYTNFWQGPLAWSGWWHNQIGLLTEIASARVASPLEQLRASAGQPGPPNSGRGARRAAIRFGAAAAAVRHHSAHRVSTALDGRTLDAQGYRRLQPDLDRRRCSKRSPIGARRSCGTSSRSTGRRSRSAGGAIPRRS